MSKTIAELSIRGRELLGTEHAIMGGAMSWVSERNLVSAISNAGAFGVIAASSMPPELLDKEIKATQALTQKPFGVNLILMHPQLEQLMDVCIANKVTHVVLAGGIPRGPHVEKLKAAGIKVIAFTPTHAIGKKLVKMGVDGIVIEGNEAGGHIGPVSTSVLAQEILPVLREVPVFVAGGIGRGEAIAAYLEMGASGVQLGTRFVCAKECIAHENFKNAFIKANARDAIPSVQYHPDFSVIPVRAINNKAAEEFTRFQKETVEKVFSGQMDKEAGQLAIEHFWAGALRKAVIDGDVERGSLMAGQSVGMVQCIQPTQEIIDELVSQAALYLSNKRAA
ncbi:MAG: nitronate monooxygenase [Alphaproteobacteria bacterium]|nr:nitronate monooxygenase [Alphaproteobacteria bacterium]